MAAVVGPGVGRLPTEDSSVKTLVISVAIAGCLICSAGAQTIDTTAPPPLILFNGAMTGASGEPIVGLVSAIFALYEEPAGGVPLWVDIQMVQADAAGGYLVQLGGATELPVDLFATGRALWLGVQPEGQDEQPRVRFTSVPYALKAGNADTLSGRPIADFVLVDGEDGGSVLTGSAKTAAVVGTAVSSNIAGAFDSLSVSGQSSLDGDVAIGSANPVGKLMVVKDSGAGVLSADADSAILIKSGTNAMGLRLGVDETNKVALIQAVENAVDVRAVSINAGGGNVGIATTSPVGKLTVVKDSGAGILSADADSAILIKSGTNAMGLRLGVDETNKVALIQAVENAVDVRAVSINAGGGNVGIGTTSPGAARLQVAGNIRFGNASGVTGLLGVSAVPGAGSIQFTADDAATSGILFRTRNGSGTGNRMVIDKDGNVGIGTVSPLAPLHVAGNVRISGGGNGLTFPDGTTQTSAGVGSANDLVCTACVGNSDVAADAVTSAEIAAGAVGSDEIATAAVGNSELGPNVVTSDKIWLFTDLSTAM